MEKYLEQLLADIAHATANVSSPYPTGEESANIWDWISDEDEDKTAPRIELEEWTGIQQSQLPPADQLTDEQVHVLLEALKQLLKEYNWYFCVIFTMPERLEYEVLRTNFSQEAIVKRHHSGFFQTCKDGTDPANCIMGEACHCEYFNKMRKNWVELTPEEERRVHLEIEIKHLKRKHGDRWMRYYPYHLDPDYDDENGNPYDYGFGEDFDEDEEGDDWWRK